jgi:hypothetical protein
MSASSGAPPAGLGRGHQTRPSTTTARGTDGRSGSVRGMTKRADRRLGAGRRALAGADRQARISTKPGGASRGGAGGAKHAAATSTTAPLGKRRP